MLVYLCMESKQRRIIQEKAKGTYQRNQSIRLLFDQYGNQAEVARQFNISRQRVQQLIKKAKSER